MRIVFMGTPQFAVPAFKMLAEHSDHKLVCAYTRPPKPFGRGNTMMKSQIHLLAESYGIQTLTPSTLRTEAVQNELAAFKPDVIVVVAYGLILPQAVLDIPSKLCINIHPSDLPRWRGAAPLQWSILSGDTESALCIMKLDAGMDSGPIISKTKFNISDDENLLSLTELTANIGAKKLMEALDSVNENAYSLIPQSEIGITLAVKLTREHEKLNFNNEARLVHRQIKAFSPKPCAYFEYKGENIKIIDSDYKSDTNNNDTPGTIVNTEFVIACGSGLLMPKFLQRPGKKAVSVHNFVNGFKFNVGDIL